MNMYKVYFEGYFNMSSESSDDAVDEADEILNDTNATYKIIDVEE